MKRIFIFALIVVIFSILNCYFDASRTNPNDPVSEKKSDTECVTEDKADLTIGYASGDSESSVTQNITLVTTGTNGSTISWASDNTNVVTTTGSVTRPATLDTTVTVTATITKNSASDTKSFSLTVIKAEATFYISSSSGNDSFDGSSSKPYATISKALTNTIYNKLTIIATSGSYSENVTIPAFLSGINIYGGYDSTFSTRNIETNKTIISAADNTVYAITINGSALLDGLYVSTGGSGIYITTGTVNINRTYITVTDAVYGNTFPFCIEANGGTVLITNTILAIDTSAYSSHIGFGVEIRNGNNTIVNCTIIDVAGVAQGIGLYGGTSVELINNILTGSASWGGSIYDYTSGFSIKLKYNRLSYYYGQSSIYSTTTTIQNFISSVNGSALGNTIDDPKLTSISSISSLNAKFSASSPTTVSEGGINPSSYGVTTDFSGTTRISPYSMGAYCK